MSSFLLLFQIVCGLAVPGIAASLAFFKPGEISIVTRSGAAFGLGYAVCGGCALILAAGHAFRLISFLAFWFAVSAVLWVVALRRAPFRDHVRALGDDVRNNRLPLLLGALVITALLILHLKFLHLLGVARLVYYLNGIEVANAGGVPSAILEYGQSWPPATDKAVLDAFTGVVVLINHNVVAGPGALLWISTLGTFLGLWATAWELGLRRTSILLPLLADTAGFLGPGELLQQRFHAISSNYAAYRAEDFGRAVAFCALALGIYAIRQRRWGPALVAGVVLAAASGSHLIPAVAVVIALCFVGVGQLLVDEGNRARLFTLRQGIILGGFSAFLGILIRMLAGGSFGLEGASNPASYTAIHGRFDPTAYLHSGIFVPLDSTGRGHWYVPPAKVVRRIMAGSGINWPTWGIWLLFAAAVLTAILLFLFGPAELRIIGIVGSGFLAGLISTALFFSYHYHIYIDGTFGVRRLQDFSSLGLTLIALGALEALLIYLGRSRPQLSLALAAVLVVALSAWVLPQSVAPQQLGRVTHARTALVDWLRTHTPCNARFISNQRNEGVFTTLTGRFALLEGMGPFLRVDKMPYVVSLFLSARQFFQSPLSHEAFLRQHGISYLVLARQPELLGSPATTGQTNFHDMRAAPFLHQVMANRSVIIYQVQGAHPPPVSPLLKGPYLHCITTPVRF